MLAATRVMQGLGGAMMVPVGRLVVIRTTAKTDLVRAIAYLTWPALVAPLVALIFLINVPPGEAGADARGVQRRGTALSRRVGSSGVPDAGDRGRRPVRGVAEVGADLKSVTPPMKPNRRASDEARSLGD
jgi:hypothetical protein